MISSFILNRRCLAWWIKIILLKIVMAQLKNYIQKMSKSSNNSKRTHTRDTQVLYKSDRIEWKVSILLQHNLSNHLLSYHNMLVKLKLREMPYLMRIMIVSLYYFEQQDLQRVWILCLKDMEIFHVFSLESIMSWKGKEDIKH